MAVTLNVAAVFPDGTSVGAYLARAQTPSAVGPLGSATDSATVSGGSVSFAGLAEDESYVVIGQVGSVWKRIGFKVDEHPVSDPAYVAAEDQRFDVDHFGVNIDGTPRLPVNIYSEIQGDDAQASSVDSYGGVIPFNEQTSLQGDFSGLDGTDAGFGWGKSLFATFGDSVGGSGLVGLERLTGYEVGSAILDSTDLSASDETLWSLRVWSGFYGANADGNMAQIETVRITMPQNGAGATGTADAIAGLVIDAEPTGLITGAVTNFALHVSGSGVPSRIEGRLDVGSSIFNSHATNPLGVASGFDSGDAQMYLYQAADTGDVRAFLRTASAAFKVLGAADATFISLKNTGSVFLKNSSAPSTPTGGGELFVDSGALKFIGSGGTVTTLGPA